MTASAPSTTTEAIEIDAEEVFREPVVVAVTEPRFGLGSVTELVHWWIGEFALTWGVGTYFTDSVR